ncbi:MULTISPECIES: S6 family peptidase [unclassified Anaerobiospirillum]|uniref:S6 family peptidase n=1 Tax=unclassified Anaerobiospirillum TaxID=2647410 RepID=UPI001FF173F8|nr:MULTISPECIES: S6 family peptidase [unclassified Anaerobiospirillum]MCK0534514.1 hypothetical protein [Anaerobiospirillum sp. NML120511]MCK0539824.1 hypothetical protein [Anaerobiospirillum sp. NML02-A-032]
MQHSSSKILTDDPVVKRQYRKPALLYPVLLPVAVTPVLLFAVSDVSANHMNIANHWFRDYLDFAQNEGIFKPGATGLVIPGKNGNDLVLPDVPFPDFDAYSNEGPVTSIGGAYMVTATHNRLSNGSWHTASQSPSWGISKYSLQDYAANADFVVTRLNKFVVETPGIRHGVDYSLSDAQKLDRYGVMVNGQKRILMYRAGSGWLNVKTAGGGKTFKDVSYRPELRSGSIYVLYQWNNGPNQTVFQNLFSFENHTTEGDSGSGGLLWDNERGEWVLAGTLLGMANLNGVNVKVYNRWHQGKVDEIKNRFTHNVALSGGTLLFSTTADDQYELAGSQHKFTRKQDLLFRGGGFITLQKNLDLGIGGFIFDEGNNYKVEGTGFNFRGAGVDIGHGSTVEWNIQGNPSDSLHKIGRGTMIVNVAQGNNLKVGDGTVELVAQHSFNQIYMASGLATVKLRNRDALNKSGNFNNIYFTRRGGTLDVNGNDQTFQRIAASDSGTVITNTAGTRANIDLTLPDWKYAYHGQFTKGLNVNVKNDKPLAESERFEKKHLILDGGMDIFGQVSIKNAMLTMQGTPTRHAVLGRDSCPYPFPTCKPYWVDYVRGEEKAANDRFKSHYKTNNERNSLDQPDWEQRTYRFEKLTLENSSLNVGRNATVIGNIEATGSKVNFGGDHPVFRDGFYGENITANGLGFDFRQQLHYGTARADDTITFNGNIRASDSQFTSTMKEFSASFDLKNNSSFESLNTGSVTHILDQGIKVDATSKLILGDVVVSGSKNKNLFSFETGSKVSFQNLLVDDAELYVPDYVVEGAIKAFNNGKIYLKQWTLDSSNLISDKTGRIDIEKLNVEGSQSAKANIIVQDELNMNDVNPGRPGASSGQWVGLDVQELTLRPAAAIKADFSNDYLSLRNVTFNNENILIRAADLIDERSNQEIKFTTGGKDITVSSRKDGNQILFAFNDNSSGNGGNGGNGSGNGGNGDSGSGGTGDDSGNGGGQGGGNGSGQGGGNGGPVLPASPAIDAFLEGNTNPRAPEILASIITHNENGKNKYQEVAIKDALSNPDPQRGAQALAAIVKRTDDMYTSTAKTLDARTIISPVRTAVDSRLASLRRSARVATAAYTPVAATGKAANLSAMSKKRDEQMLNDSVFVDVSTGYQKDGDRKERVISSNVGFDRILKIENGRMVIGGALNLSSIDNTDYNAKDDGTMYGLTGYLSWEQPEGFELQSYLTAGYMVNDRSFTPEIALGEQNFDERSFLLMSSNYFKYRMDHGPVTIRPMVLMDLGFNRVGSSESDFMKRDDMSKISLDLGAGIELEGTHESYGYLLQGTVRHNVWNSDDTVGINLRNAHGYISYEIPDQHSTSFSVHGSLSKRLAADVTMDLGLGADASTDGALGFNANARIRWHF